MHRNVLLLPDNRPAAEIAAEIYDCIIANLDNAATLDGARIVGIEMIATAVATARHYAGRLVLKPD